MYLYSYLVKIEECVVKSPNIIGLMANLSEIFILISFKIKFENI